MVVVLKIVTDKPNARVCDWWNPIEAGPMPHGAVPGSDCVLFRDSSEVGLGAGVKPTVGANSYAAKLSPPAFVLCEKDIWDPREDIAEEELTAVDVTAAERRKRARKAASTFLKRRINAGMDHPVTLLFFMGITFWALFMEDFRVATDMDVSYDKPFGCTSFSVMLFFLLDWAARTWAEDEYALSFFWYVDLVASLSMVLDSLNCFVATDGRCALLPSVGGFDGVLHSLQTTTRLARVLRLLRVLRILKIATLLRGRGQRRGGDAEQPSMLGKRLQDKIVRNVISTVIALVLLVPFLEYSETDLGDVHGLQMLALARVSPSLPAMLRDYEDRIEFYTERYNYKESLLAVKLFDADGLLSGDSGEAVTILLKDDSDQDYTTSAASDYPRCFDTVLDATAGCPPSITHQIRCSYIHTVTVGVCTHAPDTGLVDWSMCRGLAVFNKKHQRMNAAAVGIVTQLFIALLIFACFQLYSADVRVLVVNPIEAMVGMVRRLATNPKMQLLQSTDKTKFETRAVGIALAKIVGLMQLGFGGAGHEIIASNLADADGTALDLSRKGRKLDCAYGFCDIRQFTDTVECLQDQVMLFTNSVGEYVHHACNDNRGEPNKNIGDAFLIVWRQPEAGAGGLRDGSSADKSKVCDGALTAFRRCVREIASSQTLQLVTDVPAIHSKFGQHQYKTKIGFGLHYGWSVEGPVGTPAKIDCSYLSPEVKISDRLEAATKIYCCNILLSGQFYDLLSDHMRVGLRLIDHITLKGGTRPLRVYACDRCNLWLKMNPKLLRVYGAGGAYEHFSRVFHEGIDDFIRGVWPRARDRLEAALDFCPEDVPTKLLLKRMEELSSAPHALLQAPEGWKGYHESEV